MSIFSIRENDTEKTVSRRRGKGEFVARTNPIYFMGKYDGV